MITRHHVTLALICALILCSSGLFSDPFTMALVIAGTCFGAVLPDIQMTKPRRLTFRTPAWYVVQFSRRICAPLICRLYREVLPGEFQVNDKRLTHSLPGLAVISAILAAMLYVPVTVSGAAFLFPATTVFLGGVILGMGLHLVEDLCTRKGIWPFFPFIPVTLAGSIRPCDRTDPRIAQYHIQHAMLLLVIAGLGSRAFLPRGLFLPLGIIGTAACLGMMVGLSDVSVDPETAGTIGTLAPVLVTH
jgi:hypothetical protein